MQSSQTGIPGTSSDPSTLSKTPSSTMTNADTPLNGAIPTTPTHDRSAEGARTRVGVANGHVQDAEGASLLNGHSHSHAPLMTPEDNRSANGGPSTSEAVGGARPKVRPQPPAPATDSDSEEQNVSDTNDDFYVYTYPGDDDDDDDDDYEHSRRGVRRPRNGHTHSHLSGHALSADLPRSFYRDAGGSDSDVAGSHGSNGGGVGAGQSNLSNEVAAALIQIEMMAHPPAPLEPPPAPPSPDMDFLEMDFVASDESVSGNSDSGQGPDENLAEEPVLFGEAEAVDPAEEVQPPEAGAESSQASREASPAVESHRSPPPQPPPPPVPDHLPLAAAAAGVDSHPGPSGVASVPAVTPARDDLSCMMVRSRSLNSPIISRSGHAEARGAGGGGATSSLNDCLGLVSSDPGGMAAGRSRRRYSGDTWAAGSGPASSAAGLGGQNVNMEICGAKLSQKEAFLFGGQRKVQTLPNLKTRVSHSEEGKDTRAPVTEKTMLWSEQDACRKQVTQLGASACGATAVVNVFLALKLQHELPASQDDVVSAVRTRLRAHAAPLPAYLASRASAGCTHRHLIDAVTALSRGRVVARFFPTHPRRRVHLTRWLSSWLRRGAVPLVTLNPQRSVRPGQVVPDAWHHQMVFGVGPAGVYMTNPLECVDEAVLAEWLCSPSELLVRREDVLKRLSPPNYDLSDLDELARFEDERWDWYNVLGQVVNMLREEQALASSQQLRNCQRTVSEHIRIPADYQAGVTLCLPKDSAHAAELMQCADLPLAGDHLSRDELSPTPSS